MPTTDRRLRPRRRLAGSDTFSSESAARQEARSCADAEWPAVHRRLCAWVKRRNPTMNDEHAAALARLYRTGRFLPLLPPRGYVDPMLSTEDPA